MKLSKEQADLLAALSSEFIRLNARIAELEGLIILNSEEDATAPGSVATDDFGTTFNNLVRENFGSGPVSLLGLFKLGDQVSKFLDGLDGKKGK